MIDHGQAHLWRTNVPAHASRTYQQATAGCFSPRVDGQRGTWIDSLPGFEWRGGRVTFNGVGFTNRTNRSVAVVAQCLLR